ncbi:hypothetical protein AgCh_037377 [Apium graveolens]
MDKFLVVVVDKVTRELFAVKFIEKGLKIDEHVQREIMNHRSLKHPNIIRFKELLYANGIVNATHLAIVMEYAAGGELFERICRTGRCIEDEVHSFGSAKNKRMSHEMGRKEYYLVTDVLHVEMLS